VLKDADAALATMTENPYVLAVPSGTGGIGRIGVREFYARQFLPNIPPDFDLTSLSQTFGNDRIVEEFVILAPLALSRGSAPPSPTVSFSGSSSHIRLSDGVWYSKLINC
jgi:hypothetical protein